MRRPTPKGKINLRLWSDNTPLLALALGTGLDARISHDKGGPVRLSNGKIRASKAATHYVSLKSYDLDSPFEANGRLRQILDALRGTELASLLACGAVKAEIDLAAFHGDVDWEGQLDPALIEAVRALNVKLIVVHYDKFTDEGAPLAVTL